jgi:adenine-specific DNA-methyltransferase
MALGSLEDKVAKDSNHRAKTQRTSPDVQANNLDKLRAIFPQFVKDGQVDFDALKAWFSENNLLPERDEKYGVSWAGKSDAFGLIREPATGTLTPQTYESKDWDNTQNVFIEGDNLESLKLLQAHYREAIKMIYIDPPYNTGGDFIYRDNFHEDKSEYLERTGQRKGDMPMKKNTDSAGRYHSDWLTMMYPRLFLAKNLLRQDGVIFISIDDHEVMNLRHICDEIFGEENFAAQLIWQKKYSPQNDATYFSDMHDYVICYAKARKNQRDDKYGWQINYLDRSDEQNARYKNPDDDPKGPWKAADLSVKTYSANYDYEITTPSGRKVLPPAGRAWSTSKENFENWRSDNRVWFGKDGNNVPAVKIYLSEVNAGIVPLSLWLRTEVGDNQEGRQEFKKLFDGKGYFDGPKPVRLLQRMLQLATNKNDIILDFFAGSGSTAHAVMQQNAEDGGNRKYIMVQLNEATDEKSEAHRAGYDNIAQIARERIRRAGDKISKDFASRHSRPDRESSKNKLDIGFKAYKLTESNYRQWHIIKAEDDNRESKFLEQSELFKDNPLIDNYDELSVVYETLLKEGFSLNAQVAPQTTGDLAYYRVTDSANPKSSDYTKQLIVTFAGELSQDQVAQLNLPKDTLFVCLDTALTDTTKVNLARNLTVKVI